MSSLSFRVPGDQAFPACAGHRLIELAPDPQTRFLKEVVLPDGQGARKQRLDRHQQHIGRKQQPHAQRILQRGKPCRQAAVADLQHIQKRNEHDDADSAKDGYADVP
jgi:hypothetical protein